MKRIIALFISILSLTLVMLVPIQAADFDLVADGIKLLTDDEYTELNELAMDISDKYRCEVSIVIIDEIGDDNVTEYAKFFYEEHDYGYGEDKSGLMLFLSMEDRDYALIAKGYGNTAFTDHGKNVLLEKRLLPMLGKDKYYAGFLVYLNQSAEYLQMARNGNPFDVDTDEAFSEESAKGSFGIKLAATILIPLLIAGIVCGIFVGQMKTAVPERAADHYIPEKGFNLTRQVDSFLFQTETRTKIEDEKSSSGGTSTGSDGYSSSQGKF